MCIITNECNIVISISLIPGLDTIPSNWHCYFPADCRDLPNEGDYYEEKES